ncbi:MAG: formyltransferase family protein [Phycisphaeraceae bacterium]
MNIAILTANEPFYLPAALAHVLEHANPDDRFMVLIAPATHKVKRDGKWRDKSVAMRVLQSFGVREFAYLASKAVLHKLLDRLPVRRGRYYSVTGVCRAFNVAAHHVPNVNSEQTLALLRDWNVDLLVSLSCPQLFKKKLIDLAPKGCLNLHCSPLPNYRGLYPAFWMLKNNESNAGATLFFVNEAIDGGDVLLRRHYPVDPEETLDAFLKRSKRIGSELIVEGIERVRQGDYQTEPLDEKAGSYYTWPTAEDVRLFKQSRQLR